MTCFFWGSNMAKLKIMALDHIVLNVADVERSLEFYTRVLGLRGERVDDFRQGRVGFPSVRINAETIIDLFQATEPVGVAPAQDKKSGNLNHFCLVVGNEDFAGIVDHLKGQGVFIKQGPVSRWGARGRATSVYFLDPDGNEVEIRSY
jgi:catechol 2,3-dioxygenase-like lactoylglutathione lyase family enzyme